MSGRLFTRSRVPTLTAAVLVVGLAAAGCGRSGSSGPTTPSGSASASGSSSSSAVPAGDFGTEKKVCAPGPGNAGSGRGLAAGTIHIGTQADPGSAAVPGLGQEFFDTADAFAKWCNAAGGINGRKIVIDKLDAKLFNVAAEVLKACQSDFMLVGGGNAIDSAGVKPRLACKLGQIPAYTVSAEATDAGLQVSPSASVPTNYPIGPLRLLSAAYPAAKTGLGIGSTNIASVIPQGLATQEAYQKLGYRVATLQPRPPLVDNYRPYMEQMKQTGAKGDFEISAQDPSPIFQAMSDTGFKPDFVLFSATFYSPKSVKAAQAANYVPDSFVYSAALPWELSSRFPVVAQAKSIMQASQATPSLTYFTDIAFNSWVLWAKSATACGMNLSQACVLQKAASYPAWTAGGLFAPVDTNPKTHEPSDCIVLLRLTKTGFVYDQKVTDPNNGVYNCGANNLATVKDYSAS